MRWFFLFFLVVLALVVNVFIFAETITTVRIVAAGASNLAMFALARIWWHAYYRQNDIEYSDSIGSNFLLITLAAGILMILMGLDAWTTGGCEILITDSRRGRGRGFNSLMRYIESIGYCREAGFVWASVGLIVTLASIQYFIIVKRKY